MCTLVVARNVFPSFPLVLAANRDEYLARPASPPHVREGDPRILAPVDDLRGGTWIGVSDRGIVAAITNRHAVTSLPGRHTRGALVLAALHAANAPVGAAVIAALAGSQFNGFHLVVMDRTDAFLLKGDGSRITCEPLADGVHVITQFGTTPNHAPRAVAVADRYRRHVAGHEPRPSILDAILTVHADDDGLEGGCIHLQRKGYGTRSSTVIRLADGADAFDYWHREGPACAGPFGPNARFAIHQ